MRGRASRTKIGLLAVLTAAGGYLMNDCQILIKDATVSGIKSYVLNDFMTSLFQGFVSTDDQPGEQNNTLP